MLVLVGCEGGRPPMPSAPAAPRPTGLVIHGLPPSSFVVGQTAQLTASAIFPDGAEKTVTTATWKSSDTTIVKVSASGLATAAGSGAADVTASAYERDASAHVRVRFMVSGIVRESPPTQDVTVAGARVAIQGGSDDGATTITDESGRFTLLVEGAGFRLAVTRDGYDPAAAAIETLPRDQNPIIELTPNAQRVRTVFTGNLCTVEPPTRFSTECSGNSFPYPVQTHHFLAVHRPMTLSVNVNYRYTGDYYPNSLNLEIRCGDALIAEKVVVYEGYGSVYRPITRPDNVSGPVPIAAPRPCNYEIKVANFIADRKGGSWTTYRIDIDQPR